MFSFYTETDIEPLIPPDDEDMSNDNSCIDDGANWYLGYFNLPVEDYNNTHQVGEEYKDERGRVSSYNTKRIFVEESPPCVKRPKREEEPSEQISKKRRHDHTPIDRFIDTAKQMNNYGLTGLADHNTFVVINEDKFFEWVTKEKDPKYQLKKTSFLEKFDKSRPANRVYPKQKYGPIKYLRIDKGRRNGLNGVDKAVGDIEKIYGTNSKLRIITHRDWGFLDPKYFVYEGSRSSRRSVPK